jgi:hypothetical protein
MHDPNLPGAVLKVKNEDLDDLYDETAWGLNTFLDDTRKPREIAIAERLLEMQESGMDEQSLTIYSWRMRQEQSRDDVPCAFAGRHSGRGTRIIRR